jgi:DNA-binding CsgD family transcriptional regulator
MDETEQLSSLLTDVYDAALDPTRWTGVVEKSARFLGGFAVSLLRRDHLDTPMTGGHHYGLDPFYQQLYTEKYLKSDPRAALSYTIKPGEIYDAMNFPQQIGFRETGFYQEYMEPQKISDNFGCTIERSPSGRSLFGLFRREDDGPAETSYRRMHLLMPHIGRAFQCGNAIKLSHAESAAFAESLDGLSAGIFLLDAKQRVVHANASGRAMLAEGVLLRTAGGQLTANERDGRRMLEKGVAQAVRAGAGSSGAAIDVPLQPLGGGTYIAHLLPLTAGARCQASALYGAAAVLFVHKAAFDVSSSSSIFAQHYGLTPMELNVLLRIVEVGGVPEVSEMLGVARSTVKTHLNHLFSKTDTRRQADLVKLLSEFSSPLAPSGQP